MTDHPPRASRRRIAAIAVALLAGVALLCIGARVTTTYIVSGDEPHYLVIAGSITHDGDVDVKNDYLQQRYRSYYPDRLDPHVNTAIFTPSSPHWYSEHEIGVPLLVAPLFAAWGLPGAEATMILVAVALVALTYLWSLRVLRSQAAALLSAAAVLISSFFLGLQGYVFPDLLVALLLVSSLLLLESRRTLPTEALLGIVVGAAPWVHVRTLLIVAALLLIAVWQIALRDRLRGRALLAHLAALLLPFLVLFGALELAVHQWFGSWDPTATYRGAPSLLQASPLETLPRILFGGLQGVFPNNPVWLLAIAGLGVWFVRARWQLLRVLAVTLPTLAAISTFSVWRGGIAPPGRFAMSLLPALAPAVGFAVIAARTQILRAAVAAIFAVQVLFTVIDWRHGFGWNDDPVLGVLRDNLGVFPRAWLPNFDNGPALPPLVAHEKAYVLAFVVVLLALLAFGYTTAQRQQQPQRGRPTPSR